MLDQWREQLKERSGNFTTNDVMPAHLAEKLLEEDQSLKDKIVLEQVNFPELEDDLKEIQGLNVLAGLQRSTKEGCLTVFRAVRFPTYKRMHQMLYEHGYAISNYEQERISHLYNNDEYRKQREQIRQNPWFWTQPQERIVSGLPLFHLANDALQIHRAFRGEKDRSALIAIHIPHELIESNKIKLIANSAIDLEFGNEARDFIIKDFIKEGDTLKIDFQALQARGIDLHEMYTSDLPLDYRRAEEMGITQDFFLLDIYKISNKEKIAKLFEKTEVLKRNKYFLHGFFGDQNIFGRRASSYLPEKCYKIERK